MALTAAGEAVREAYDESIRPAADMRIAGVAVRDARLAFRTNSALRCLLPPTR